MTGSNGCSVTTSINIPNEDIPVSITETITPNVSCLPPGDGAISISITPPDATKPVEWKYLPELDRPARCTYSVTVDGRWYLYRNGHFHRARQSEVPQLNAIPDPTICNQENGGVTLNVIGGLAPLTFSGRMGPPLKT